MILTVFHVGGSFVVDSARRLACCCYCCCWSITHHAYSPEMCGSQNFESALVQGFASAFATEEKIGSAVSPRPP